CMPWFAVRFCSPAIPFSWCPRILPLLDSLAAFCDESHQSIEVPLVRHAHKRERRLVLLPAAQHIAIDRRHFGKLGYSLALDQHLECLTEQPVCRGVIARLVDGATLQG